jgi:hypothetical protein
LSGRRGLGEMELSTQELEGRAETAEENTQIL